MTGLLVFSSHGNEAGVALCVQLVTSVSDDLTMVQVNPDKKTRAVFWDARFLTLAAVLGIGCTASYYVTGGSLVAAALTHWLPVQLWLFLLGGLNKTQPTDSGIKKE